MESQKEITDSNSSKSSFPLLSTIDKQMFRLRNFFQPYSSEFKLSFSEINEKIKALDITPDKKKGDKLLNIKLDPRLLKAKNAFEKEDKTNIDSSVLNLALSFKKQLRESNFDNEEFYQNSKDAKKLDNLLEKYLETKQEEEEKDKLEKLEKEIKELNPKKLKDLWLKIRLDYFPGREDIDEYKVSWSGRKQTSCLASCHIQKKKISVAKAMKEASSLPYLEPLLYHEMCHAILGEPKIIGGRRIMHGKDFKDLEKKHPQTKDLNAWIKAGGWEKAVKDSEVQN